MLDQLINRLKQDKTQGEKLIKLFREIDIAPKTTLLEEGEIARNLYFVKKGCLRLWILLR